MRSKFFKRSLPIILLLLLALSFTGCRRHKDKEPAEKTTEEAKKVKNHPDYAAEDVELPKDFGNMIYPIEALMVERYSKKLPYYTEKSDDDEKDSFWFSMAVLTSQMNHYVRDVAVDIKDGYIYIDEDTTNMYASALYDAFARGELEFPERGDDNPYVKYDDEKGIYGFRQGNVGDLQPYLTKCEKAGKDYIISAQLKDKKADKVLGTYEITITPSSYESEDPAFHYSVLRFDQSDEEDEKDFSEKDTEDMEESTREDQEEEDTESTEETDEEDKDKDEDEGSSSSDISVDEAEDKAKAEFGNNYDYSYKGKLTDIGDEEYYNFEIKGDDLTITNVLVSTNGNSIIGGVRNDDGSWSFDQ